MISQEKLKKTGFDIIEQYFRLISDSIIKVKELEYITGLITDLSLNQRKIFVLWVKHELNQNDQEIVLIIFNKCKFL